MSSLLAREEPLLKQLVRSRACKRRDPLSLGFGPQIRNTRSFSQPPPRQREPQPSNGTLTPPNQIPVSPGTYYTLQFLPYSLVCQTASLIPVSLSQPDLRNCGLNQVNDLGGALGLQGFCSPPTGHSRCSSVSPRRCPSPLPRSPCNGSCYSTRPGTPTHARACSPASSRPTTPTIFVNSHELYHAGNSDFFSCDHPPDFSRTSAFSQKTMLQNFNNKQCNSWSRDSSPCRDDTSKMISSNWEKSLEVERCDSRKYSLTDNIIFPRPETPDKQKGGFVNSSDSNNNSRDVRSLHSNYYSGRGLSKPCCCFNDLCCKVCLVFSKDDANLTLEQLQARAIENIVRQRNLGGSGQHCECSDCKPRPSSSMSSSYSPDNTVVSRLAPNKNFVKKATAIQKKGQSYEVLMLTSNKCEVCGIPDKGPGLLPGQFPCGHTASHRRASNVSTSSGYYNTVQDSPVPSPTGHFLTISGSCGASISPAPVKDSSKSLLASICSASGSNQGAIDNRIEQAMDLVKSHLMNAVRSEVEELKEKIIKLEDIITQLQTENEFLRANVNRDVLMQLQQQQQLQMQQQQALPSPPSQPALPPAQQPSI